MNKLSVTLIGTFRKDPAQLHDIFSELSKKLQVISPRDINFVDYTVDFVKTSDEANRSVLSIEEGVLDAIRQSDFVWLFAPGGYVGISGSFEIGFAHALGIPVYTDSKLQDEMLETMITRRVASVTDIPKELDYKPGAGIAGLQKYYARISKRRGWADESPRDTMLLLIEEIGELARAIRKSEGLKRDAGYDDVGLLDELADVQLYLVHLASTLSINLDEAVTQKELKNQKRFENTQ